MITLLTFLVFAVQGATGPDTLPPKLAQAENSLHAGRIDAAIDLAKDYTWDHRNDPRGFLVLGDAYAARMPAGRFQAWKAYREAERLAPNDPAPPYRMALTGFMLGQADGERLAGDGLQRVLELDPHYQDAWTRWLTLYRNDDGRRGMIERLRKHDDPEVESWIARLQIELNDYAAADSNLDTLIARDSANGSLFALKAQSLLEAGNSLYGTRYYYLALRHADNDAQDILWHQVVGIATPQEIIAWHKGIPPAQRGAWLAAFWERRNPDLFDRVNRRLVEHFQRLRYARAKFPLQHPLILYNQSQEGRALNLTPSSKERSEYIRCEAMNATGQMGREDAATVSFIGSSGLTGDMMANDQLDNPYMEPIAPIFASPAGIDLHDVDTISARVGYNLASGLNDQGLMYLRFGPPDAVLIGSTRATDSRDTTGPVLSERLERIMKAHMQSPPNPRHEVPCSQVMDGVRRWHYPDLGWVRFAIPSMFDYAVNVNTPVFRPMNNEQFHVTEMGLTRDASSVPARLSFGVWFAEFRNATVPIRTDLAVITTVGEAAAELVDTVSGPRGIVIGANGHVTLRDAPGDYELVADARQDGKLGRTTMRVHLKAFAERSVSDLLVSRAGPDSAVTRGEIFARVPRDLTFSPSDTLRAYAEVYGLPPAPGGARYHVTYALLKTGHPDEDAGKAEWPGATTFAFDRARPVDGDGVVHEFLDLGPKLLSSGTYLLRVTVLAPTGTTVIGSALSQFTIR